MLTSIVARARLVLNEITYWMVGNSPESHHANAAYFRYQLGHHQKCIQQCNKFLNYSKSDQISSMLGYSYGAIGQWDQAALAYRCVSDLWQQPLIALGLAEAELRSGNVNEARMIVATVEVSHAPPPYNVALALDQLNSELEKINSEPNDD